MTSSSLCTSKKVLLRGRQRRLFVGVSLFKVAEGDSVEHISCVKLTGRIRLSLLNDLIDRRVGEANYRLRLALQAAETGQKKANARLRLVLSA